MDQLVARLSTVRNRYTAAKIHAPENYDRDGLSRTLSLPEVNPTKLRLTNRQIFGKVKLQQL